MFLNKQPRYMKAVTKKVSFTNNIRKQLQMDKIVLNF